MEKYGYYIYFCFTINTLNGIAEDKIIVIIIISLHRHFAESSCSQSCVPEPQWPLCSSSVRILPAVPSLRNTVNLRLPSEWHSLATIQSYQRLQGAWSPHSGIVRPLHTLLHSPFTRFTSYTEGAPPLFTQFARPFHLICSWNTLLIKTSPFSSDLWH